MGPPRGQRRRLAFYRCIHTVRARYRSARRDYFAGGRLERHSQLRLGGAAGGATWLLCCRSRELISVPMLVVARGPPARPLDPLTGRPALTELSAAVCGTPSFIS